MTAHTHLRSRHGEEGYLLLGLVVVCFLILLTLSIAAPRVARQLERDREVESEHRALEYVRAIQLYYRKNSTYPTSIEQLLGSGTTGVSIGTTTVKYLRQQYKDPITGGDYRLIHQGEAKTEVKGFFGEPLQGIAPSASIAGTSTPGTAIGAPAGSSSGSSGGFSLGSTTGGAAGATTGTSGTPQGATNTPGTSSTSSSGGYGTFSSGTDATTFGGSKGAIVGVGSNGKGPGLIEWNGSANIEEWEFLYDPRVEQLKAKVSIFGGSPAASGTGSLGSGFQPAGGIGASGATGATGASGATGSTGTTGSGTTGAGGSTGSSGTATPNQ